VLVVWMEADIGGRVCQDVNKHEKHTR
jgi:hypothetical protein